MGASTLVSLCLSAFFVFMFSFFSNDRGKERKILRSAQFFTILVIFLQI